MTFAEILGQLVLGWLLADLVTGAFHWWEDNFGSEQWPLIGAWIIRPNRLHHRAPLMFTRHNFLDRNGASIVTAMLIAAALALVFGPRPWICALAIGGALSNEVHRYAHQPSSAPAWLRVLQEIGVCQSPKAHAVHHRPPHSANFCVLTDLLNPVLEASGLWRGLGAIFGKAA